jgi:HEAT repeat protein
MKWFMMLLIFIGGVYFLVNKREKEALQKAVIAEEQKKAAPEPSLPPMTEKVYAMRFSLQTIRTLRSLTADANDKVRFASVELLWQLQDDQAPALIKRMFREETEPEVKKMLIDMLSKDKSRLSLVLLAEALNDYDKDTRLKAVEAISTFSSREAISALTQSMQDYDEDIRLKSLQAINQIRQAVEANKAQQIQEVAKQPLFKVE